jgi:hypothetical protein
VTVGIPSPTSARLTGKCPEILETIEFISHGKQTTNISKIFGDPDFTIDLTKKDDFFVKVIELRTTVKRDRDKHQKGTAEYERLEAMQLALKLIANATSYGILVEVIVDERAAEIPCMIYHGGQESWRVARKTALTPDNFSPGFKVEKPGKYFCSVRWIDTGRWTVDVSNCRDVVSRAWNTVHVLRYGFHVSRASSSYEP